MIRATLSILALYNYDNTIFDGFSIPDGLSKSVLLPELLSEVAELESLYTNPETLKILIPAWSGRRLPIWEKLYATTQFDYNPIWNVDANETETIERERTGEGTESRTGSETSDGQTQTTQHTATAGTTSDTSTNSAYGYNSSTAEPHDTTTGSGSTSGTSDTTTTGTDTASRKTNDDTSRSDSETETVTTTKTRGGNIGVTMTQQLIEAERRVDDFDIYQIIIDDFKNRFCLLLY